MSIRSKLFATVAFPMLSVSIAIQPALADSLMKPFEVAQQDVAQADSGEPVPEELLRKKRKQRAEQAEEQPAQEEEQPSRAERRKARQDAEQQQQQQEEQPSRTERKKRQDAERQQQEQPSGDDEAARAAEEKARARAERRKQQAEQQQQQEEQPSRAERKKRQDAERQQQEQPSGDDEAARAAEEKAKARAERRKQQAEQQQQQQEEQPSRAERKKRQDAERQQQEQPSGDDEAARAAEEKAKARAERKKRQDAEQQQQQEEQPAQDEQPSRADRKKRQDAEQQQQEAQPATDDEAAQKAAEERRRIRAEQKARAQGGQQDDGEQPVAEDELRPAIDADGEPAKDRKRPDRRKPIPEVVDTRSQEEKQEIARDPSKSDDTVVLPVDNGAAVLDSDKEADNVGDEGAREKRRKRREQARAQEENVEVPKTDEEAQSRRKDRRPTREELGANIREEGRRVERVPEFGVNDLIDAFTGNGGRRPRIDETRDNRTVLDFGDQIIVRGDDRPRLRRNAQETYYEELSRGRSRETIERPNGVRIVTIYNSYGDIIQRLRIDQDGREYLMIYAPEADDGPRPPMYDVGEDLPPMRLRVPVRDYIIDTSSEPDRDYYDFLAEPPVEQVERTYTIDEVRNSARIRDKVRRIDLDTITFATGSAEVPMSQAKTLRKVADAMLEVIEKDPGETFFIEGHTDAVGSDESNLVLSDERAESVASLLTEVYEIPAENLVTQGYGERFLKVRTQDAEQENRRVTIRRVTPLVRPVAQK
ncbi:OmpA family protein [Pararhizobium sp. YC-54]|uniref:OmpA family protein n=1 Tax=Pararhizobium sp. YC-54 TaxID=2986920 RepID=UPI0021F6E80B|nr:OmpA family protein [Pararhizobium sp. YC-54]MCV9996793.1 OmpA family protein [Pararhizobium sp. YC-54]